MFAPRSQKDIISNLPWLEVTKIYTLGFNTISTQILRDGNTACALRPVQGNACGLGRISQQSGTTPEYFLGDALGSVRQMTDQAGGITFARNYDPYGTVTSTGGTSQTKFGFTGEQYGDSTQLLYLRARYYNPADGRFLTKDPSRFEKNLYRYASANPINFVDPTGLYAQVDCSQIYLPGLRYYCEIGNGDESNRGTIDARWKFFNIIANDAMLLGTVPFYEGYYYAGKMLKKFVNGFSGVYDVQLPRDTTFGKDYGILRATKIKLPPYKDSNGNPIDEPQEIRPLLYVFLQDHVQLALQSCTTYLLSDDFKVKSRETWSGKDSPRPYNTGWWGAFGHVKIDATYSNTLVLKVSDFYIVRTKVQYNIFDQYAWFYGKSTPFGPPLAASQIDIPHEWEISLVNYDNSYGPRANMYYFNVGWSEPLNITLTGDFSEFSILGSGFNNNSLK